MSIIFSWAVKSTTIDKKKKKEKNEKEKSLCNHHSASVIRHNVPNV